MATATTPPPVKVTHEVLFKPARTLPSGRTRPARWDAVRWVESRRDDEPRDRDADAVTIGNYPTKDAAIDACWRDAATWGVPAPHRQIEVSED